MNRSIVLILGLLGLFGACSGCSPLEKAADYGVMTGGIPTDSWFSSLGSGKNQ